MTQLSLVYESSLRTSSTGRGTDECAPHVEGFIAVALRAYCIWLCLGAVLGHVERGCEEGTLRNCERPRANRS